MHLTHQTLKRELEKIGFKPREEDSTIFFCFGQGNIIDIAGWYIDDGLLTSNSKKSMEQMVNDIRGSFDIKDLGEPKRLLGIKIVRDRENGTIHIPTILHIHNCQTLQYPPVAPSHHQWTHLPTYNQPRVLMTLSTSLMPHS